jgi:hypothetical protein
MCLPVVFNLELTGGDFITVVPDGKGKTDGKTEWEFMKPMPEPAVTAAVIPRLGGI